MIPIYSNCTLKASKIQSVFHKYRSRQITLHTYLNILRIRNRFSDFILLLKVQFSKTNPIYERSKIAYRTIFL